MNNNSYTQIMSPHAISYVGKLILTTLHNYACLLQNAIYSVKLYSSHLTQLSMKQLPYRYSKVGL